MAETKVTPVNSDDEFVTVSDGVQEPETKIVFDTINDTFTGTYLGTRDVTNSDGKFLQYRFQNGKEIFFTNANYNLREGMKTVRTGSRVRITYVDDLDTGQAQPMRCFRVEVAKQNRHR